MDDREKELRLLQIKLAFANNLRTLRQRLKVKQPELAARCGLHRITVVRLETGQNHPSLGEAVLIAEALGVSLDAMAKMETGLDQREA